MTKRQAHQQAGKNAIAPNNDLVASATTDLRESIKAALAKSGDEFALDLANVGKIDSTGIGLLIATHNSLSKAGRALRLLNVSGQPLESLRGLKLDQHFDISDASTKG